MNSIEKASLGLMNTIAAGWAFVLAFVILADVLGRLVGLPIQGTVELVANSIVAIVFLQFPLAIQKGVFLRTTLFYDVMPAWAQSAIDIAGYVMGCGLFLAIAVGGWSDMITGFRIGEFEGDGALRIPVYPVRAVIFAMSIVSIGCYLRLIINRLRGLVPEGEPALETEI